MFVIIKHLGVNQSFIKFEVAGIHLSHCDGFRMILKD